MTIEELEAENKKLKGELEHARSYKHTIKMRNRNLHTENENLKAELKDLRYNLDDWRNKADTMEARVKELEAELKQTEAQDQVVIDGLREENEKLRCAVLHGLYLHCEKRAFEADPYLPTKWEYYWTKFEQAYRKAKAKLRSSNG